LDTYHPNTLYLCQQGCKDSWIIFKATGRNVWETLALIGSFLSKENSDFEMSGTDYPVTLRHFPGNLSS
jgi:hypothetical protein